MADYRRTPCALDDIILPPLTVNNADDDGIRMLRDAIVLDACKEYMKYVHVLKHSRSQIRREHARESADLLGRFFKGKWFQMLTLGQVDGQKTMHTLMYDTPAKWLTPEERKELRQYETEGDDVSTYTGPDLLQAGEWADEDTCDEA